MIKALFVVIWFSVLSAPADDHGISNNTFIRGGNAKTQRPKNPNSSFCTDIMSDYECEVFALTNKARENQKLKPLKFLKKCYDSSRAHSRYMAKLSSKGRSLDASVNHDFFKERVKKFKIDAKKVTENVAGGTYKGAEDLIKNLMSSEGHRKNILDSEAQSMAVAVVVDKKGHQFWTQCFSSSR